MQTETTQTSTTSETYHVTRTHRDDVLGRTAYGHSETACDASGCAGSEQYLGSYDPSEVEHDGEHFWTVTDSGLTVHLLGEV